MKVILSKQVYDQLVDKDGMITIACHCVIDDTPDPACDLCEGLGTLYQMPLTGPVAESIKENLRRQGVTLDETKH